MIKKEPLSKQIKKQHIDILQQAVANHAAININLVTSSIHLIVQLE
jgi:hypothetical protein